MAKEADPDPLDPRVLGALHAADRYLRYYVDGLSYADAVDIAQEIVNQATMGNAEKRLLLPARTDPIVQKEKPIEEALGWSYIGIKGLLKLEQSLQGYGANVEFHTSSSGAVSPLDLHIARGEKELYFHHPDKMVVNGEEVPLTMANFVKLFRNPQFAKVPELASFQDVKWFENEYFAREEGQLRPGSVFVGSGSVPGSFNSTFERQLDIMETYKNIMVKRVGELNDVRCRTPFEALFDRTVLFFYRYQFMQAIDRVPAQLNSSKEAVLIRFEPQLGPQISVDTDRRGSSFIGIIPTRGIHHPASRPPKMSSR